MTAGTFYPRTSIVEILAFGVPLWARLKLHERCSPGQIRRFQERKLREVIAHAARHVPYYRARFRESGLRPADIRTLDDLKKVPILTKGEVRAHADELISEMESERERLHYGSTTGSTGAPVTVALNRKELVQSMTLVLYGHLRSGRRLTDKFAHVFVPPHPRQSRLHERLGVLREYAVDLRRGVENNLAELGALQPQVLYGYPSYLYLMARCVLEHGEIAFRPRLVLTNGEVLTPAARSLLARAFQCEVRDTYGSAEFNRIAYECPCQTFHVIPASVVVEVDEGTRDADGYAEILVTGLYLKTMPLIRYRLGDRVLLSDAPCPCGSRLPVIKEVMGRSDDYLTLPSGRKISARAVNLLEDIPGILEYQIIQRTADRVEVWVKPGPSFNRRSEERIREVIVGGCRGESLQVNVIRTDDIGRLQRGKRRAVVSEVT